MPSKTLIHSARIAEEIKKSKEFGININENITFDIPKIINLSRLTYSKMIQNLFWATGYNVVAIPLAAGALVFQGILLQPALAAALMSLSTIIVAFNAVLMRRKKI